MKNITLSVIKAFVLLFILSLTSINATSFDIRYDKTHGGILGISPNVKGVNLNYVICADGSQYEDFNYQWEWGVGSFVVEINGKIETHKWNTPILNAKTNNVFDNRNVIYNEAGIEVSVKRNAKKSTNKLIETYTFKNTTHYPIKLRDISINTPINDNYPKGLTCLESRVNANIWAGYNSSYIQAVRMNNESPSLGLVLRKGCLNGYEINGRNYNTRSNVRGIISMLSSDQILGAGESYVVEWELFLYNNNDDFYKQSLKNGFVKASAEKYTINKGEKVKLFFESSKSFKNVNVTFQDEKIPCKVKKSKNGFIYYSQSIADKLGEHKYFFNYDGKKTPVEINIISSPENLLKERANFIINHQQMNNPHDLRYGAYMVYDNEKNNIYLNKDKQSSVDHDEGAERLGMGVFLALQYQKTKDINILKSLKKYAKFVRVRLQSEDYQTWSSVDWHHRNRAYNYPWVAHFYLEMYKCTREKQYLLDCAGTMKALFRNFGYGFYALDMPFYESVITFREAGLDSLADEMLKEYEKEGEICLQRGKNYPRHEVVYEQSIVAPYVTILAELYLLTKKDKYLQTCKQHMEFLKAFNGQQPSNHLNDIGIRHWDGFWFGKRQTWGDVFPHYWTTATALAFERYSKCTGDMNYHKRAINIVRNNLCQFFEDGRASCAYMYANKVNGKKCKFYDPWANDQDWALAYYIMVTDNK